MLDHNPLSLQTSKFLQRFMFMASMNIIYETSWSQCHMEFIVTWCPFTILPRACYWEVLDTNSLSQLLLAKQHWQIGLQWTSPKGHLVHQDTWPESQLFMNAYYCPPEIRIPHWSGQMFWSQWCPHKRGSTVDTIHDPHSKHTEEYPDSCISMDTVPHIVSAYTYTQQQGGFSVCFI